MKKPGLYFTMILLLWSKLTFANNDLRVAEKVNRLSLSKFENPKASKDTLIFIINNESISDSLKGEAGKELSVCYGIMNQFDKGIEAGLKALPLLKNQESKVVLYRILGTLYLYSRSNNLADSCFKMALKTCDLMPKALDLKALTLGEYANYFSENYNYSSAIKILRQAIAIRDSIKNDPPENIASLRLKMITIFIAINNYEFAEKESRLIINQLENSSTPQKNSFLGYAYQKLGLALQIQKRFNESNSAFTKSIDFFRIINNQNLATYALSEIAHNKLLENKTVEGLPIIRDAFQKMKKGNSPFILSAAINYLEILNRLNIKEEGASIYNDTLVLSALNDNYSSDALNFYKAKMPFIEFGNNESAKIENLKKIIVLSDSVYDAEKLRQVLELQAQYQLNIEEKDSKLLLQENQLLNQKNNLQLRMLFIWIIIATTAVFYILYRLEKNKRKLLKNSSDLLLIEQENKLLSQKAETEEKERILKEQVIEQQRSELLLYIDKIGQLENDLLSKFDNNLKQEMDEIRNHLKKLKDGKEYMELFMVKFNTLYPHFGQMLLTKYSGLNNSDIVFCALFRINLTTKEIGSVLNIAPFSVYRRKYRMMEKMGLKTDDQFKEAIFGIS